MAEKKTGNKIIAQNMIQIALVVGMGDIPQRAAFAVHTEQPHLDNPMPEKEAHQRMAQFVNRRADSTRNKQNTIARIACIFKERSTAKRDKKAENDYHSNRTRKLKKQMSEYLHRSSLSKTSYLFSSLESCLRYAFINPSISPSITESMLPSS